MDFYKNEHFQNEHFRNEQFETSNFEKIPLSTKTNLKKKQAWKKLAISGPAARHV